jgi:hypothetical protein
VYKDLLQFYLDTVALFEESHFVLRAAFEILKPTITNIVSSFQAHMEVLSCRLEAESFATIQEIKDEQVEALSECSRMIPEPLVYAMPLTHCQSAVFSTALRNTMSHLGKKDSRTALTTPAVGSHPTTPSRTGC